MEGGQVGTNFMMTEEDYDIHRLASMWFFLGPRGDTQMTFTLYKIVFPNRAMNDGHLKF